MIKGVPTDITDKEFLEFFDLNKINYTKAECLKSKKDGRVLPICQLEINDPTTFSKSSLPSNQHSVQGGGISGTSFGYTVLQLPKFRPFGEELQVKTKMSDLH